MTRYKLRSKEPMIQCWTATEFITEVIKRLKEIKGYEGEVSNIGYEIGEPHVGFDYSFTPPIHAHEIEEIMDELMSEEDIGFSCTGGTVNGVATGKIWITVLYEINEARRGDLW